MTTEREQQIAEIVASIRAGVIPEGLACVYAPKEPPGAGREVLGWEAEAGEEDQTSGEWDVA